MSSRTRTSLSTALAAASLCVALAAFSCDADLEDKCRDGTCGGFEAETTCDGTTCDAEQTHGLPCGVYKVFRDICQNCHIEGGIGPFLLKNYQDTQCVYPQGSESMKLVWQRAQNAVLPHEERDPDAGGIEMPLGNFPLPDACLDTMRAWFATCESGECERGQGTKEDAPDDSEVGWCDAPEGGGGSGQGAGTEGAGGSGGAAGGAGGSGGSGGAGGG